jgi:hypothetical protein
MGAITWRYLVGDTSTFAAQFTFVEDDVADSMVNAADRRSWGSLSLWIAGQNVCAHSVQDEYLESAHWYLFSVIRWFADNWDPLFHEERLNLPQWHRTPRRQHERLQSS